MLTGVERTLLGPLASFRINDRRELGWFYERHCRRFRTNNSGQVVKGTRELKAGAPTATTGVRHRDPLGRGWLHVSSAVGYFQPSLSRASALR